MAFLTSFSNKRCDLPSYANMASTGGAIGDDSNDEKHSQSQVRLRRSKRIHTSQSVVPSKNNQRKKSATQTLKEILKTLPTQSNDEVYKEETAWRFHNQNLPEKSEEQLTELREVSGLPSQDRCGPKELNHLPKAPPLPPLPDTGSCKWSFNEDSRVLLADFCASSHAVKEGQVEVIPKDKEFLLTMMERDDITVISQGLANAMNPFLYSNEYIKDVIGSRDHHKVRRFTTTKNGQIEGTGWHSMKFGDYFDYIKKRGEAKDDGKLTGHFTFKNSDGEETTVDLVKDALVSLHVSCCLCTNLHYTHQRTIPSFVFLFSTCSMLML